MTLAHELTQESTCYRELPAERGHHMRSIVDALFVISVVLPPVAIVIGALLLAWPRRSAGLLPHHATA
jgi:hypothetical protein